MTVDDLHVAREGRGDPLLFLVGLGGRAEFWSAQFARFRDARECISFDHRRTADRETSVAGLAEDAIRLLDDLGFDEVDIVGHSLGGAIAQHIAVHRPERVRRLVFSASWCGPTPWFLELFALRKRVLVECGPRDYLMQGSLLGNPSWWTFANQEAMVAGIEARLASFAGADIECARMDAVTAHDLRDRVGEITAPTLVVCARDDGITPLGLSEELQQRIRGAQLEVLPTGSHFAPSCVPDDWAAPVRAFLA